MASQFSTNQFPQTAVAYKGNVSINGYPAGPKDSYMTVGGFYDTTDINNGSNLTIPFGTVASAKQTTPDQFVLGMLSGANYVIRGIAIFDQSISYNEAFKPDSYAIGMPATLMVRGYFRLSSWGVTGTGSVQPYLGCVPQFSMATGAIEFLPSGTTVASNGFRLFVGPMGNQCLNVVDVDPLLGSTSNGGALLYVSIY
jgi:hypothetical protein